MIQILIFLTLSEMLLKILTATNWDKRERLSELCAWTDNFLCAWSSEANRWSCLKLYRSKRTSSKFQSLTMSLLTAWLLTRRGAPVTPDPGMLGWGITLDDVMLWLALGCGSEAFLAKQFAIAEHLPSLSELDTE